MLSVLRRVFASGCRAGFVLSFSWLPSESNFSDRGSRFFDHDCDPIKSLLHVLAQRLTRSSPSRTSDEECFCPLLKHLDVGEVDVTSHIHVPAVSVQSHVPSDDLCDCTGHAASVSSQRSSVTGKIIASAVCCLMCELLTVKLSSLQVSQRKCDDISCDGNTQLLHDTSGPTRVITKWQHGLSRRANGRASAPHVCRNTVERPTEETKKRSCIVQHLTSPLNAHSDSHSSKSFLPTTHFTSCVFARQEELLRISRSRLRPSSMSSSAVILHCASCKTFCKTASDFLEACFVKQSSI